LLAVATGVSSLLGVALADAVGDALAVGLALAEGFGERLRAGVAVAEAAAFVAVAVGALVGLAGLVGLVPPCCVPPPGFFVGVLVGVGLGAGADWVFRGVALGGLVLLLPCHEKATKPPLGTFSPPTPELE
jgi:hypothetical protein